MQQETVVYEQPLNERVRALLRLEYLFERATFRMDGPSIWDSRASVEAIIDIMHIMSRTDLKTEIIQELERDAATLEALGAKRGVDLERLNELLGRIRDLLNDLRTGDSTPGQDLRQHELLSYVRQRSSIPAGTCSFDIPAYQHWLERPAETRVSDIRAWLSRFEPVQHAKRTADGRVVGFRIHPCRRSGCGIPLQLRDPLSSVFDIVLRCHQSGP